MSVEVKDSEIITKHRKNKKYKNLYIKRKHDYEVRKKKQYENELEYEEDEFIRKMLLIRIENVSKRILELESL